MNQNIEQFEKEKALNANQTREDTLIETRDT